MLIGAVADDITGATDLCLMLSRAGLHTVQIIGVPNPEDPVPDADAVVVALKSRTIDATLAVEMSVSAARFLMAANAKQLLFKYCSTFDSTDAGNIGPVTEALLNLTEAKMTIACPAFPANGRTVYLGHLFVGRQLVSDSPMKDHPLTPMRDSDLVRVLGRQTTQPVGLIDAATVRCGAAAVQAALDRAQENGARMVVVDAMTDEDLLTIGEACKDMPLVTGGSGIALGLAANFTEKGAMLDRNAVNRFVAPSGRSVVLAGSCSAATRRQITCAADAGLPMMRLDVAAIADKRQTAMDVANWAKAQPHGLPPVIYSSADPSELATVQSTIGRDVSGKMVESFLADVACELQSAGFRQYIVAGGETSGAVVQALGVKTLEIGPEIDPGVPWTRSVSGPDLVMALKSGNFGSPDFFVRAWSLLDVELPN